MKAELFLLTVWLLSATAQSEKHNPCSGLWLGEIVADPRRCDRYFRCYLQVPHIQYCPDQTVFNPTTRRCEYGDPSTCEIHSHTSTTHVSTTQTTTHLPTQPPTQPSTEPPTIPPPANFNDICSGIFFAARPYPQYPTRFVGCIKGFGFLVECDQNEWFNFDLGLTGECSNVWP